MKTENIRTKGIEQIADYFLSSPPPTGQAEQPHRKDQEQHETRRSLVSLTPVTGRRQEGVAARSLVSIPDRRLILFITDGFPEQTSFIAAALACRLGREGVSVGLVETTTTIPTTFFLHTGCENVKAICWEKVVASYDFVKLLNKLDKQCDFLVVNVSRDVFCLGHWFSQLNPFFVIATSSKPEDLLKAYILIKELSHITPQTDAGLFVVEESPGDSSMGVFGLLEEMARRFLFLRLHLIGPCGEEWPWTESLSSQPDPLLADEISYWSESIGRLAESLLKRGHETCQGLPVRPHRQPFQDTPYSRQCRTSCSVLNSATK